MWGGVQFVTAANDCLLLLLLLLLLCLTLQEYTANPRTDSSLGKVGR
jgi:hypothetical protein